MLGIGETDQPPASQRAALQVESASAFLDDKPLERALRIWLVREVPRSSVSPRRAAAMR